MTTDDPPSSLILDLPVTCIPVTFNARLPDSTPTIDRGPGQGEEKRRRGEERRFEAEAEEKERRGEVKRGAGEAQEGRRRDGGEVKERRRRG